MTYRKQTRRFGVCLSFSCHYQNTYIYVYITLFFFDPLGCVKVWITFNHQPGSNDPDHPSQQQQTEEYIYIIYIYMYMCFGTLNKHKRNMYVFDTQLQHMYSKQVIRM